MQYYYSTLLLLISAVLLVTGVTKPPVPGKLNAEEVSPTYWENQFRKATRSTRALFTSKKIVKAKNVILFLGDGMGLPTVAAGRFLKAEVDGTLKAKGKSEFSFEKFSRAVPVRTYDLETEVTDSASSATAYLCGTKTRTEMLGVTGNVEMENCNTYKKSENVYSILSDSMASGKATGIVTTTRVTHATPGGAYAHTPFRNWEDDTQVANSCGTNVGEVTDIAKQLVDDNSDINVVIGGGRRHFLPKESGGYRTTENLVEKWKSKQAASNRNYMYVDDPKNIQSASNTDYLLGLLYDSDCPFDHDRPTTEASLSDMVQVALDILMRNGNGFFLLVEGGRIDHAHHSNLGRHALNEALAFEKAINDTLARVNQDETLILVTADHSHAFSLVARPSRFTSVTLKDNHYSLETTDNRPMTAMGYMNGPGSPTTGQRPDITEIDTSTWEYAQQGLVPLAFSTHGGEDVPVYVNGPSSWIFHRTVDNTFLAQAMKYISCVGPYTGEDHCSGASGMSGLWIVNVAALILLFISL